MDIHNRRHDIVIFNIKLRRVIINNTVIYNVKVNKNVAKPINGLEFEWAHARASIKVAVYCC